MSRALRSGAPRVLGRHDGAAGGLFDVHYRALQETHGPFTALLRQYAGSAAAWWAQFVMDTRAVKQAEDARLHGKGRRPGAAAIARLKKRQGLSWQSYEQAARRLEEMASARRRPRGPLTIGQVIA